MLSTIKAFWIRDAIMATSYKLSFVMQVGSLLVTCVGYYFLSKLVGDQPAVAKFGGYLPFSIIGVAMSTYFTTGFDSYSGAVRSEQMMGTLESVLMTPTSITKVIFASSAWDFFWSTLQSVVLILSASLFFGITLKGSYILAGIILLLTTLTFSCLGVISASFIMVFKRGDPLKFFVNTFSYMLGGAVFPITLFPAWLQKISYMLPITHGLNALREVLLLGKPLSAVWGQVLVLLCFAVIGVPLSALCFQKAVNLARREGSLLHY